MARILLIETATARLSVALAENAVRMLTAQLNKKPVRNIALPYIFGKAAKHEKNQKNNTLGKSCR